MVAGGVEGGVVHGTKVPDGGVQVAVGLEARRGEAVGALDEVACVDGAVEGAVAVGLGGLGAEGVEGGGWSDGYV